MHKIDNSVECENKKHELYQNKNINYYKEDSDIVYSNTKKRRLKPSS